MVLSDLQVGQSAVITDMSSLEYLFKNRLIDMGIYVDAHVALINMMARGKMLIVEIDDVEICIRRSDAERIQVR